MDINNFGMMEREKEEERKEAKDVTVLYYH